MRVAAAVFLCGATLAAQSWPTFFSAYEDGLEARQRGDHALAARAFSRAIALEPQPLSQVKTYGLNYLYAYYPYLRLAESRLALGDLAGAEAALAQSRARGAEPVREREALAARLTSLRRARDLGTSTSPLPHVPVPTATPIQPAPSPAIAIRALGPAKPDTDVVQPRREASPGPAVAHPTAAARGHGAAVAPAPPGSPLGATPRPPPTQPPMAIGSQQPVATTPQAPRTPAVQPSPSPLRSWGLSLLVLAGLGGVMAFLRRRARMDKAADSKPQHSASAGSVPASSSRDAEPGTGMAFGPFHTQRELGRGGTATAYYGIHKDTGAEVAIKVPHPHLVKDPDFRARFRREAALGALLDHPRIVRIVDPGPLEGEPWIALSYIHGRTLEDHLADAGALPVAEALDLALDLTEAIAYAHGKGVVHRDLKPANVMLSERGPVIMDFGIARMLDTALTSNTMFIGTPGYTSPEGLLGPRVGPPADRYAIGLILFEMLAGHPPFRGETLFHILDAQRSEPLPDLARIRPDSPPRLIRLIERLCAKAPEDRPEDMEVLQILEELKEAQAAGGLRS